MEEPPIILHATPPLAALPASDIESVYLVALLQLTCGTRWGVRTGEWADGDRALPYITHLDHRLPAKHLGSLPTYEDPYANLSATQKAESLSWRAYVEGQLSDLVNYVLYSLPPNYPSVVVPAQLSGLTFPISQYLPQRIRSVHRSRLEHVGLWGLGGSNSADVEAEDRKRLEENYVVGPGGTMAPRAWTGWRAGRAIDESRRKIGQEEVLKRAKAILDPLQRKIGSGPYLFGSRLTTVDLYLFSHLTFLLTVDWPNPLLTKLLRNSYGPLVRYHDSILQQLFGSTGWSSISRLPAVVRPSASLWQNFVSVWKGASTEQGPPAKPLSAKQRKIQRQRWIWYAFSAGAMLTYIFASGLVSIERVKSLDAEHAEEAVEPDEEESIEEEEVIVVENTEQGEGQESA